MSSTIYAIVPAEQVTVVVQTGFSIEVVELILNTSAKLKVSIYQGKQLARIEFIMMEGADYLEWGNDDEYLVLYVANTLGFTLL